MTAAIIAAVFSFKNLKDINFGTVISFWNENPKKL
jgi:hypothetical protein